MDWTYEEVVLGALDGQIRLEEREPDEQGGRAVEGDLRDEVRRVAPVGLSIALEEKAELVHPRSRVFALETRLHGGLAAALSVDALEVLLDTRSLRRLRPRSVPIDISGGSGTGTDSLEDVLSPEEKIGMSYEGRPRDEDKTYGFSESSHLRAPFLSK